MAYSSSAAKAQLLALLASSTPAVDTPEALAARDAFAGAMADWITAWLPTLQVSTTVAVTSVSGVTTGPGVSGPGAGTGAGTVS